MTLVLWPRSGSECWVDVRLIDGLRSAAQRRTSTAFHWPRSGSKGRDGITKLRWFWSATLLLLLRWLGCLLSDFQGSNICALVRVGIGVGVDNDPSRRRRRGRRSGFVLPGFREHPLAYLVCVFVACRKALVPPV